MNDEHPAELEHPTLPFELPPAMASTPGRGRGAGQRTRALERQRVRLRWERLAPGALETQGIAFGEWVLWLVETYALWEVWPACWFRHPGIVEELTALWAWHLALDTDAGGDGAGAVGWHAALWRFMDRSLPVVTRRCLSSHQVPTPDIVHARGDMVDAMRQAHATELATETERRRVAGDASFSPLDDRRPAQ